MDDKALSPVVSMMLILSVIVVSVSVFWANYVPVLNKRIEITNNEKLYENFLNIATVYSMIRDNESKVVSIKLGGGESTFGQLTTSSTLRVKRSGIVRINFTCIVDNSTKSYDYVFNLFSVELETHNNILPNQKFVFSEGGIKIWQFDKNITKLQPSINDSIKFNNNTLEIRIDNLTTKEIEISGNSIGFLILSKHKYEAPPKNNCSGFVQVNDSVFGSVWKEIMKNLSTRYNQYFYFNEPDNKLEFENVNISITVKDYAIAVS